MRTPLLSPRLAFEILGRCLGLCVIVVRHSKGVLIRLLPHIYASVLSVLNSPLSSRFVDFAGEEAR